MDTNSQFSNDYGPRRLSVELGNICNLHCSYCLRSEDNLYSHHAQFLPVELLRRILSEAHEAAHITRVIFTGGEPTLHPEFAQTLETVAAAGMNSSFVTNGWLLPRRRWRLVEPTFSCSVPTPCTRWRTGSSSGIARRFRVRRPDGASRLARLQRTDSRT